MFFLLCFPKIGQHNPSSASCLHHSFYKWRKKGSMRLYKHSDSKSLFKVLFMCGHMYMWMSESNLPVLSFYFVGLRHQTWVVRHGSKCLYVLSCFTGPNKVIKNILELWKVNNKISIYDFYVKHSAAWHKAENDSKSTGLRQVDYSFKCLLATRWIHFFFHFLA